MSLGRLKSRLAGGSSVFTTSLAGFDLAAIGGRFFTTATGFLTGAVFLAGAALLAGTAFFDGVLAGVFS
ncbi:hypothetical protein D3C80_2085980 [compost metagenome]